MSHQAYACFCSLLFLFEVLLEARLFDAVVVFDDEGVPFSLVFGVFACYVVVAEEAAFKLL